jgi:hypothetical protein
MSQSNVFADLYKVLPYLNFNEFFGKNSEPQHLVQIAKLSAPTATIFQTSTTMEGYKGYLEAMIYASFQTTEKSSSGPSDNTTQLGSIQNTCFYVIGLPTSELISCMNVITVEKGGPVKLTYKQRNGASATGEADLTMEVDAVIIGVEPLLSHGKSYINVAFEVREIDTTSKSMVDGVSKGTNPFKYDFTKGK